MTHAAVTPATLTVGGTRGGFALLSIMVAVVLLATGVMAIGAANTARLRQQTLSTVRSDALTIARTYLESVRSQDPWTVEDRAAEQVDASGVVTASGPFTRSMDVTVLNTNLLLIVVEVRGPRLAAPIRLTTNLYRGATATGN